MQCACAPVRAAMDTCTASCNYTKPGAYFRHISRIVEWAAKKHFQNRIMADRNTHPDIRRTDRLSPDRIGSAPIA